MSAYKLCMLGDGAVGKTSLLIRLCSSKFFEEYDPTIEDSYRKQMVIDNKAAILDILDTTGQDEYITLRDQWIGDSEGFLVVFSITNRKSFHQVQHFRDHIYKVKEDFTHQTKEWPIVIVSNKMDLEAQRVVMKEEIGDFISQIKCQLLECSAKTNLNVDEAFREIVRAVRVFRGEVAPSSSLNHSNSNVNSSEDSPNNNNYEGKKSRVKCSLL